MASADSRAVKPRGYCKAWEDFKFDQRIEMNIKTFRTIYNLKDNPSEGSTFFKDCLLELRVNTPKKNQKLNIAADFILFYEEILPFVQTLPLVILNKELIFAKLVSGLQMKAKFSQEAFLRLIAALSRDLLEDLIPFLPLVVNSLVDLLKNGDQNIIKQIFRSWYHIMMHLQKYLIRDIEGFLRDTLELRYYPNDYIRNRLSALMSNLLRNAHVKQLEKGIKMILSEVADPLKKGGGVSLLYYLMRCSSMSLHSKARKVLRLLLKDSTLSFCDNFPQGTGNTVEAVSSTLQRICGDFKAEELSVVWNCLYTETKEAMENKKTAHLSRLLTVLTSVVKVEKGLKICDYSALVGLVSQIVSTFMDSFETVVEGDNVSDVLDKLLGLMLCTIDRPSFLNEIESIALQWAPIFSLKSSRLLTFLWELQEKDKLIVEAFTSNILSSINNNMSLGSSEENIPLLLSLCVRQQTRQDRVNIIPEICFLILKI